MKPEQISKLNLIKTAIALAFIFSRENRRVKFSYQSLRYGNVHVST